jgi:formylglycine-generating enzyme required for sulfatase activity
MVLIPAGDFLMGSASNVDSVPVHKVSVAAFYIDKYEVTQELYEKITGKNPSRRKDPKNPVERVRWREAAAFCNQRSAAEGLKPCYDAKTWVCDFSADGYHLPTEAQWEYACRGGSAGVYSFGDDSADLKSYGWFKATADRKTHPVGELKANPFGLFDVAGNVAEWCNDWYGRDYYAQSPAADPTGPSSGEKKVVRGGGFKSAAEDCTCAARNSDEPGFSDACVASDDYGFRCVRRAAPK